MRALCWHGKKDIRCDTVPDPEIEAPRDAIVKVTSCAICGSDLHLYDGFMPGMESGDIMGHEFMGEVVEVGAENRKLKVGDRVVVPFTIVCGECDQCRRGYFSVCERTNRNKDMADKTFGHTHRRPVRLHAPDRRLSGRPGRVCPRPLCRCRPRQDPEWAHRRAGSVSGRHLPDRLAGRGPMRHRADRYRGDLGLRSGRPVLHPQRGPARRQAGDRDRPRARAPLDGASRRRHHDRFRG